MTSDARPALELIDVRYGFRDRPDFLGSISFAVRPGECWSIVGPNGAGKSTLLRLMAGLHHPSAGEVQLDGEPLNTISHRQRAQTLALVPQRPPTDLDLTVREIVLMGRFPHRSLGLFETTADHAIAEQAMTLTETLSFADRSMTTLSGGEAQRVHVAAALAQEPRVLLLDEPTSSLDLRHQLAVFEILRDCANPCAVSRKVDRLSSTPVVGWHGQAQRGHVLGGQPHARASGLGMPPEHLGAPPEYLGMPPDEVLRDCAKPSAPALPIGVVVVTHDVNLAARFCSHVLLLHEGKLVAAGKPSDVLTPERLQAVYGVEMATLNAPDNTGGWLVPVNVASGTQA